MPSEHFKALLKQSLEYNEIEATKNDLEYIIEQNARGDTVGSISVKLKNAVEEELLAKKASAMLRPLANIMAEEELGIVDNLLVELGLSKRKVGRKRVTGKVQVNIGTSTAQASEKAQAAVTKGNVVAGKSNLRSALEIIAKKYIYANMTRPTAPLKYRTGRFLKSMKVTGITEHEVSTSARTKPRLSIWYTYMVYPYAVFDPAVSSRPELCNRPYPGARNPQVLIGEALAKAARDVFYDGYSIDINQRR